MCDYSLECVASRPAKVGDSLKTARFKNTPSIDDPDVVELAHLDAVKLETSKLCGTMLADAGHQFWDNPEWRVRVTDEAGALVLTVKVTGEIAKSISN